MPSRLCEKLQKRGYGIFFIYIIKYLFTRCNFVTFSIFPYSPNGYRGYRIGYRQVTVTNVFVTFSHFWLFLCRHNFFVTSQTIGITGKVTRGFLCNLFCNQIFSLSKTDIWLHFFFFLHFDCSLLERNIAIFHIKWEFFRYSEW